MTIENPFRLIGLKTANRIYAEIMSRAGITETADTILDILLDESLIDKGLIFLDGALKRTMIGKRVDVSLLDQGEISSWLSQITKNRFFFTATNNPISRESGWGARLPIVEDDALYLLMTLTSKGTYLESEAWEAIFLAINNTLQTTLRSQRMRAVRDRYLNFFEKSNDFHCICDPFGGLHRVNAVGVKMLGLANEEALLRLNLKSDLLLDTHDFGRLKKIIDGEGFVEGFNSTLVHRDGRPVKVAITGLSYETNRGALAYEFIIRDTTAFQKSVRELQVARRTIDGILQGSPVAMFVLDNTFRVAYWNRACEILTGVTKDKVLGSRNHSLPFYKERRDTMADVVLRKDMDKLIELFHDKNLSPSSLAKGGFVAEDFFEDLGGAGKYLYFCAAPFVDENDKVSGVVEVILDMTDRHRLEQELAASEAKYREMVEQSFDGIIVYDRKRVYFSNQRFLQMFDIGEPLANEQAPYHLLTPETRMNLFEAQRALDKTQVRSISFEGRGIRPDQSLFHLEIATFKTVFQRSEVYQSVFRDISDRKAMEEQLLISERMAVAGKLAFNVAHEINNPVGGIYTYTHLLLEEIAERSEAGDSVDEDLRVILEKILKLSNRCKVIVGGLLDFAREDIEGRRSASINEIIEETLSLLEGHAVLSRVLVQKDFCPDLPNVFVDRTKIGQVVMNLIINAAESLEGPGLVSIKTNFNKGAGQVKVCIKDTGRGIPPEHMKKLFEPFFSTKPRGRGTGLGLAISHGIVKQHGGAIVADSIPGQGSVFTFTLPIEL